VPNGGARKAGYTLESSGVRCVVNRGVTPWNHKAQEGVYRGEWYNSSSGETSVGMYRLKEVMEKSCSDLQVSHQKNCGCALAGMVTWMFSS
jgi:hypothetical protein